MTSRAADGLAVATMTLVRDPQEDRLLRRALTALTRHGWPVFLCDGGSNESFVTFLRRLPGVTLVAPAGTGLVGQVRASLTAAAAARPLVIYSESDKESFFERELASFVERSSSAGAGIAIAARSDQAFETYPRTQQRTETAINHLCGEFLGISGDYTYGPFLVRSNLVGHTERIQGDLGWGWRPFLFASAHRLGNRVTQIVGDFECPFDQRVEDERDRLHRLRQVVENMSGLLAGFTSDLSR